MRTKTRLRITYWTKSSQTEKMREISPVRLVNYKNRWYLQAWCHLTDELRTFSLEYILAAEPCAKNCRAVPMKDLEALDSGFGIFSGGKSRLRLFTLTRRWAPTCATKFGTLISRF